MCPRAGRAKRAEDLAGYYAHCTALDDCFGELRRTLQEAGLAENTILVFTADHGDMLGSQGAYKKQRPYDESIRVPLLLHWPKGLASKRVSSMRRSTRKTLCPRCWACAACRSRRPSRVLITAAICAAERTRGMARR